MADFSWIGQLGEDAWRPSPSTTSAGLVISLDDFALRSGTEFPAAIAAFREWSFEQRHARYSLAWTDHLDPQDMLVLVRRGVGGSGNGNGDGSHH
ncbi:MAG: hypothetical protein ABWZ08_12235 [Pseudoxanthomonas sp.]